MTADRSRHRSPWTAILLGLLACVLVIGGVVGIRTWRSVSQVMEGGGHVDPFEGRVNIALLGADSAQWREGARIDSVTVASVDAETGRTLLVSIPRNLVRVPFSDGSPLRSIYPDGYVCPEQELAPCMLTTVYQKGIDNADLYPGVADPGSQATVEAVEGITGLSINYYALIDMDGFSELIDALGGIDLTVTKRIPVGALGNAFYWIEPGLHHFSGEEALWYVRTRVNTDDYERMSRQKCVMMAALNKVDPTQIATNFLELVDAAAQTASTNAPISQLPNLVSLATKAKSWSITGLSLSPPLVDPLQPEYSQIARAVAEAINHVEALDRGEAITTGTVVNDLRTTCGF